MFAQLNRRRLYIPPPNISGLLCSHRGLVCAAAAHSKRAATGACVSCGELSSLNGEPERRGEREMEGERAAATARLRQTRHAPLPAAAAVTICQTMQSSQRVHAPINIYSLHTANTMQSTSTCAHVCSVHVGELTWVHKRDARAPSQLNASAVAERGEICRSERPRFIVAYLWHAHSIHV